MEEKKKRPVWKIVLLLLALLLTLALVFVGTLVNRTLDKIEWVEKEPETVVAPADEDFEPDDEEGEDTLLPEEVVWEKPEVTEAPAEEAEEAARITNILLIGQDRRPGEVRARSDSMILCSINEETDRITLVSLMRDMYVPFPGEYSDNRINAAYAFGGMALLDQLIEEDFGVVIDGNLEVDFGGFIDVMNQIAPLEIELKSYEVGYMNSGTDWNLHQGVNAMTGEQLLRYARMRYVGHADFERTERQRRVIGAAFEKLKDWKPSQLLELAETILPCMSTDMSKSDLLDLVTTVAVNRMTIGETYRLPAEGSYSGQFIRGMAVLVPDLKENSRLLREYLYGEESGPEPEEQTTESSRLRQ